MRRFLIIFIIVFMLIINFNIYTYADSSDKTIMDQSKEWIEIGKEESENLSIGETDYWSELAGLLTGIGIWVSIISGSILGIRLMIASPDDKAQIKKQLIIWIVGSVVIMGALTIWKVSLDILDIY